MISGEKLKKLRLMRNLTQKELAIKSGLTDAAIRNYELGNRSPSKEQLQKISEALDCDISALINHEPNSIFEIMHIIFDYEKDMKFEPLSRALKEFNQKLTSEWTDEQYEIVYQSLEMLKKNFEIDNK